MQYTSFTSESVSCGHPDKICDQISDAIVDRAISHCKHSRVAVETLVTKNRVVISGEVTCPKHIDYVTIARGVIKRLGFTKKAYRFSHRSPVDVFVHQQSSDIAQGVDAGGAGDQGMMFGYACNETKEYMPLPIVLAHQLVFSIDTLKNTHEFLRPDGKTQITVLYENGVPKAVSAVVIAVPHDPSLTNYELKNFLVKHALIPVLGKRGFEPPQDSQIVINGTGKWSIGGPFADTGVTGRKIAVDTYGGMARIGGGCFSGKDPTKVDRSAAYAARFIAKNLVAKGYADRCEVQLAYAIGKRQPVALEIETYGTENASKKKLEKIARQILDCSVSGILSGLNLLQPHYEKTAVYGHFGRGVFPWEQVIL